MKHSRLAPSKAYQWSRCTASIKFIAENEDKLPPENRAYADEGVRAHAYLTACLKHTLGQVPDNEEMRALIQALVAYVQTLCVPDAKMLVDVQVPLYYLPEEHGTLDVAVLTNTRLTFIDLKYGAGVSVYAEKNEQLAIYAESEIRKLEEIQSFPDDIPVDLVIWQPRDRNDSTVERKWTITRRQLRDFCHPLHTIAQKVLLGRDLKFLPGVACKFCRAGDAGICTAKGTQGLEVISDQPIDVVLDKPIIRDPNLLTREQRQRIIAAKSDMIAFLEGVENREVAELLNGAPPQLFKLVEGKSNRQWSDETAAKKLLSTVILPDEVCPPNPKIISPKQAEDILKTVVIPGDKEQFMAKLRAHISKPAGKPTLVPIEDKRPALVLNPTEGLSKISEYDPRDLI